MSEDSSQLVHCSGAPWVYGMHQHPDFTLLQLKCTLTSFTSLKVTSLIVLFVFRSTKDRSPCCVVANTPSPAENSIA